MSQRIVLLDSGGANLGSVLAAFKRLGLQASITDSRQQILRASHIILPGVGTAQNAMNRLKQNRLIDLIPKLTQPLLGICIGMQLLFESSAEGDCQCLGLLKGKVDKLIPTTKTCIPHMGWNQLEVNRPHDLVNGLDNAWMYFVHSYAVAASDKQVASTEHGYHFSAVVSDQNICGVQFHPERSSVAGTRLLNNFLSL